jgi:hypothetical protein
MVLLRRVLHIKEASETEDEVRREPHVRKAEKTLDRFYESVSAAEQQAHRRGR